MQVPVIASVTPRVKSLWLAPVPRLTLPLVVFGVKSTGPPIRAETEGIDSRIPEVIVKGPDVAVLFESATAVA